MFLSMDVETTMIFVWLGVAVLCLILEVLTTDLISVWCSIAGVITMIFAIFIDNIWIQFGIFIIFSFGLILATRPLVVKYFKTNTIKTNFDALEGKIGLVTKDIIENDRGEVFVDGKYWTAISQDGKVIKKDTKVIVLTIEGVKLIVKKEEE